MCIQAGLKEIKKKLTDILLTNSGNMLKSPISVCHFENFLGTRFPGSRTFSTSASGRRVCMHPYVSEHGGDVRDREWPIYSNGNCHLGRL